MSKNKYINPIPKPEMVSIPKWEYAALVRASTLMEVAQRIIDGGDKYGVTETLKTLFKDDREGE